MATQLHTKHEGRGRQTVAFTRLLVWSYIVLWYKDVRILCVQDWC